MVWENGFVKMFDALNLKLCANLSTYVYKIDLDTVTYQIIVYTFDL